MRAHLAALVVVSVVAVAGAPASATVPGQNGKIAFEGSSTTSPEIFTVNTNGTGLALLTAGGADPAWSPNGSKVAFDRPSGSSSGTGIWTITADRSHESQITTGTATYEDRFPTWSPDGTKIAFVRAERAAGGCSRIYVVGADGTNPTPLAPGPQCRQEDLDWSPDGSRLAYSAYDDTLDTRGLYVANADNSAATQIQPDGRSPSWSPGGNWIVYSVGAPDGFDHGGILRTTPDGHLGPSNPDHFLDKQPDWSPDGSRIVYVHYGDELASMNDAGLEGNTFPGSQGYTYGHDPDWQPVPPAPVPPGYARPRGATPLYTSLVPAFEGCFAPNETHGSPLAFGSCSPPVPSSSTLTVGTPDANGQAARSIGNAALAAITGNPGTAADEADIRLSTEITDVRCRAAGAPGCDAALADYTGGLREMFGANITDGNNGGLGTETATGTFPSYQPPLMIVVPCVATADTAIGATCSVDTTADAILPGVIREGMRATWALGRIEIWDAGEDGNPISDDNTLFAVQGVFVP
jgi:TolB protein